MHEELDRRAVLKGALTLGGLAALGIPYWTLPALAQGEEMVPFTDVPGSFKPGVTSPRKPKYPRKSPTGKTRDNGRAASAYRRRY